ILDVALSKIGDKGLFTKELEVALTEGRVDLCVHSMKDVPTVLPEGLTIAAMPPRVDVRDALVARGEHTLETLPVGSKVGTGSLRRLAQLRNLRSDFEYVDLRGNLDTRLGKVKSGEVDAVILASAGITRMGWQDAITQYIPTEQMVSAVGQGAIGIEIREDDTAMLEICERITCRDTMRAVEAERYIMRVLEGGCQVPIGAYARLEEGVFRIDAIVASLDGSILIRSNASGSEEDSLALAQAVVEDLLSQDALKILNDIRTVTSVTVLDEEKAGQ
ncbi:MAG: hydroxymethylbilane synthase, partial [Actinobacteria bacterium]|nr:hydroxymethylbilane synthase [Actinomycetota bacterium]